MSKIFEALQARIRSDNGKTGLSPRSIESSRDNPRNKQSRQSAQEQLADVYFQDTGKKRALPPPTVIRVAEHPKSIPILWIMCLIAVGLSVFTLFSSKKINVSIEFVEEPKAQGVAAKTPARELMQVPAVERFAAEQFLPEEPAVEQSANFDASQPQDGISAPLPRTSASVDLKERKISPLDFDFSGAAVLNSSRQRNRLTLVNSTLSGLAYATLKFDTPLPISRYRLFFEARGQLGGEKIEFVFKDKNLNSSLNWRELSPFPNGMTTQWQSAVVEVEDSEYFDAEAVSSMRVEFGSLRTHNRPDAVVFIKNLRWVPKDE